MAFTPHGGGALLLTTLRKRVWGGLVAHTPQAGVGHTCRPHCASVCGAYRHEVLAPRDENEASSCNVQKGAGCRAAFGNTISKE